MLLSKENFNTLLDKGKLVMSLIGMSNIGKTNWSQKLTELNFCHISCDDLIEQKLVTELRISGQEGVGGVARWMGKPYESHFFLNQKKYLQFEMDSMCQILSSITNDKEKNIVIDTTGSIVHTTKDICRDLKANSIVVYIKATDKMSERMVEEYFKNPKPVIWGDIYNIKKGETHESAVKRCYPKLLNFRNKRYEHYADVIISHEDISKISSAKQFLSLIEQHL